MLNLKCQTNFISFVLRKYLFHSHVTEWTMEIMKTQQSYKNSHFPEFKVNGCFSKIGPQKVFVLKFQLCYNKRWIETAFLLKTPSSSVWLNFLKFDPQKVFVPNLIFAFFLLHFAETADPEVKRSKAVWGEKALTTLMMMTVMVTMATMMKIKPSSDRSATN